MENEMSRVFFAISLAAGVVTLCNCGTSGGTDAGSGTDAGNNQNMQCPDGGSGTTDTWCNYASGFFQTYCISCHYPGGEGNPSGTSLDFNLYSDVSTNSATIRCGVAPSQDPSWNCTVPLKQFPLPNTPCMNGATTSCVRQYPTDQERSRLVNWINAGAPE
jgi:hypothetical protein